MWPIRVLVVQPSPGFVLKAVKEGFDVWAVVDPSRYDSGQLRLLGSAAKQVLAVDLGDLAVLDVLVVKTVRRNRIAHVLCRCGRSHGLRRQSMLMPGPSAAVRLLDRVDAVRSRHAERGSDVDAALDFGFFAALRDQDTAAQRSGVDDTEPRPRLHRDFSRQAGPAPGVPAVVVTTLTFEGMHQVVGVTATSSGHLLHPAPLTARQEADVRAAVTSLLDLVGYERGPAHVTVMLTENGARVDSARTWFGPDEFLSLLEFSTGLDLETELVRMLTDGAVLKPSTARTATVQFLRPGRPGRLVSVAGLAEASRSPGVVEVFFPHRPGELLTAHDAGFLLVEGASAVEARSRALQASAGVRVVVEED
ncbi:hypothetical protein SAMN05216553_109272 [Lentzea fradiae]|uniref:L-amino acid ligase C-terminal domain-containing protein n=2 Tax=Lentzea fradiae TaxID=200378 RepID=A0A1G7VKJ2_9PSEU|nr:hypothetical protein SAMN05216553_109272 [Lentzea fradiae]